MIIPITCKPVSSLENKTGSWRTTKRPKFIQEKCIGCQQCVLVCPENCIKIKDKKAIADLNYCKGCSLCAGICPAGAIEMISEEQQEKISDKD